MWCPHLLLLSSPPSPKPGGWQQRLPQPHPDSQLSSLRVPHLLQPRTPSLELETSAPSRARAEQGQRPAARSRSTGGAQTLAKGSQGRAGPPQSPSVPLGAPRCPPAPQCSPRSAPARWRPWPGLCPPRVLAAEWLQYGHRRARPAAGRGGTGRAGAGGNRGGSGEGPGGDSVEPPPPPHGHRRAPRGRGSGLGQAREGPEPPQRGPGPGRGASP